MTIKEYCKLTGISQPAVSYRIKNGKPLPGIKNYKFSKVDRIYILIPDGIHKINSGLRIMFNSRGILKKNI